ncbi:hypothetical protein [Devosia sp. Root105]|uniref:hypothetical protein n=1 Tax=Devosia sp. Root105 TaxID=1736423 RepID=UPI000701AA49|nr:hypothetical protein [Devosia sp. Root105]KQU96444.1 hypothetical protein ASC68_13785 [Devosia sp. Root105]
MRIKITKPGIYNAKGEEIRVGTELDVKGEPTGWAGRYEVISGSTDDKEPITAERDELKKQANELGIEFPRNITTEKLKELIDAKLAA